LPGYGAKPRRTPCAAAIGITLALFSVSASADQPRAVVVEAGERYRASWITRLFLGGQWRDLWTAPIEVPVLDLASFDGGLTPDREGGGLQTKNLRFKSANGRHWVFRSVDKDPTRILIPEVRESIFGYIAQDLTSTINPGGALITAPLLEAAGVLHATPVFYVMPDDPGLGEFRASFAGLVGMVESRDERGIPGVDKVETTFQLLARLEERSDEQVDARDYLRVRLIDILVGDWDRHLDQWRWVRFKEGGLRSWRAVPRDRDQAFSRFTGILPSIAEYYTKQLTTFDADYPSIEKLTFSGRYTDRRFLARLEKEEWDAVTVDLVAKLSDAVIADAVHHLPEGMYGKAGAKITQALQARRDQLRRASEEFYRLLARDVDIRGTEGADDAEVLRNADGSVEVSLYPRDEGTGQRLGPAFFHRVLKADETDEIRLYMLGGADRVVVEGAGEKSILVRIIIPGVQAQIIDRSLCTGCTDIRHIREPKVAAGPPQSLSSRFETLRDWGQDLLFFPQLGFDSSRGLVVGATGLLTRYRFGLDPFSDQTTLGAVYSTGANQPRIDYLGYFRTRSPISVLAFATYSGIDQLNFYNLGNETIRDPALVSSGFYRVSQKKLILHPLLDFAVAGPLHARLGVLFKYVSGVESAPIAAGAPGFGQMTLSAAEAGLNVDATHGTAIRERGFKLSLTGRYYPKVLSLSTDFAKARADASYYVGTHLLTDFLLALHVAGEKNWGRYPFFEAAFLGGIPGAVGLDPGTVTGGLLRGHDLNRFAGDASVVGNAELRAALGSYNSILPMRFGLLALGDLGRVFLAGESSKRWHTGAGGGLWVTILAAVPGFEVSTTLNTVVVASDEGTSFYLSSGFGF
jgi:hypothetical protein